MSKTRIRYMTKAEVKEELLKQIEAEKRYLKVVPSETYKIQCLNKIAGLEEDLRRLG